jgi:hypothetical protein
MSDRNGRARAMSARRCPHQRERRPIQPVRPPAVAAGGAYVRGSGTKENAMTLTLDLHPIFRNEREVDRAVRAIIFKAVQT